MSGDTFPFTSASLRSLRLEQEFQDWEDARRALAHRRSMARAPLPRAPRSTTRQRPLQEVRAPPPQMRCRDIAVHNTFMYGDMKGVYTVLKDPGMVNALLETVKEEMVWTPEMGTDAGPEESLTETRKLQHVCVPLRQVDTELQGEADVTSASGRQQRTLGVCGGAAVSRRRGER